MVSSATESPLQEATVVDTDVHLTVSAEAAAKYLDEPYRSQVKHATYTPLPFDGWDREIGGKIQRESVVKPDDVQGPLCEEFNIDYPLLNALPMLSRVPQSDFAVNLMRAYNDLLLDQFLDEYDHFLGLATVTTQQPDKAAEEVDRIGDEDQIVGILFDTNGPNPPVGDPEYDIIYEAIQDNDLQVAYHGSVNGGAIEFPRQNQAFERFLSAHTLFHSWGAMMTLTSVLVNGVPEKFPDLNFTILEAGIGWVPYLTYRLNKEYSFRRAEAPLLEKSPEEYVRDQFYFGTQPIGEPNDPSKMQDMIEQVGTDSVVFATDYPHWDFDHPDGVDSHLQSTFPEEDRQKVLYDNAARAFDL